MFRELCIVVTRALGLEEDGGTPLLADVPKDLRLKMLKVDSRRWGITVLEVNDELQNRGRKPLQARDVSDAIELRDWWDDASQESREAYATRPELIVIK